VNLEGFTEVSKERFFRLRSYEDEMRVAYTRPDPDSPAYEMGAGSLEYLKDGQVWGVIVDACVDVSDEEGAKWRLVASPTTRYYISPLPLSQEMARGLGL